MTDMPKGKGGAHPSDRATRASPQAATRLDHPASIPCAGFVPFTEYLEWNEAGSGPAIHVRPEHVVSARYCDYICCFDGMEYSVTSIELSTGTILKVRGDVEEVLAALGGQQ